MPEKDYVLGTHDIEIERLGLQHRVWRQYVLESWRAAGVTVGSKVLDAGSGPGYATVDLAEIVGPSGKVFAVERSHRFNEFAKRQCDARGLHNVGFSEADLMEDGLGIQGADVSWCRWVASFVPDPAKLVQNIGSALVKGGRAIFHDYFNYEAWAAPVWKSHAFFVQKVVENWRDSGGEPDIALVLPKLLTDAGFKLASLRPLVFAIRPGDFLWQWPKSFIEGHTPRLVEMGRMTAEEGASVLQDFRDVEQNKSTVMLTPVVMEIIAEKV